MTDVIPIIYSCCEQMHVAYLHPGTELHGRKVDLLEVFEPGGELYRIFAIRDATSRESERFSHLQGLFTFMPDGKLKWAISTEEGNPFYENLAKARSGLERMQSNPELFNDLLPDSIFLEK